ncbi:MAG: aminopeptidase P family protein [Anaerolineales bacterium]|nr:aminopeptidase P family protein [Anaerolineales bacterium]MCB9126666.1 aminopeptidase P family protein [Ardenticatenales bacterium]MCB9171794.1 aminopeptidase P family protein [Ardenticatenales bacterium]
MNRAEQLRREMAADQLDAFVITTPANRRYLSGFTGSSGVLIITPQQAFLVTDFRYVEQANRESPGWALYKQEKGLDDSVADLLNKLAPARVGFEADHLTVASYAKLRGAMPHDTVWVSTEGAVRDLRAVKGAEEIDHIRAAQQIADRLFEALPTLIQPGRTERAVAWEIEQRLRHEGADGPSFPVIVASGPNSALPHHRPTEREIQPNEIVLTDFGATYNGYQSDCTRTWFTGEPTDDYRRRYAWVYEALHMGQAALAVGAPLREADQAVRDHFDAVGQLAHFGHSLGHGVGLEVHEMPSLSFRMPEEKRFAADNVVTVEPGLYYLGWGGIRLENLVHLTDHGVEILSGTPFGPDLWREGQRG